MLTQEKLKSMLHYAPDTGVFTWVIQARNNIKIGDVASSIESNGYVQISIKGVRYFASRLAWFYMTGEWPKALIDHRDLDKQNNRWENLREATKSQNSANSPRRADNKSGLKGVGWHKRDSVWEAAIRVNGKAIYLGRYDCPAAGSFAYQVAADIHFGEFARI